MTDTDTPSPRPDGADRTGSRCRRKPLTVALAAVIGATIVLGGLGVVRAVGAHWDDDDVTGFILHGLDHAFDRLDATAAQRERITPVIIDASGELETLYRDMKASRQVFVTALTGETVDRGALETLRGERIAALDAASRTAITALADAVEALTPAQRQQLGERLTERMEDDDD